MINDLWTSPMTQINRSQLIRFGSLFLLPSWINRSQLIKDSWLIYHNDQTMTKRTTIITSNRSNQIKTSSWSQTWWTNEQVQSTRDVINASRRTQDQWYTFQWTDLPNVITRTMILRKPYFTWNRWSHQLRTRTDHNHRSHWFTMILNNPLSPWNRWSHQLRTRTDHNQRSHWFFWSCATRTMMTLNPITHKTLCALRLCFRTQEPVATTESSFH